MIALGQAETQVATRLPPAIGHYSGWEWQAFYNAILHVLQNPKSQAAYYRAYEIINALPARMKLTPQELTAAWARFAQLYPEQDYTAALDYMQVFLKQAERLLPGDQSQWWTVESRWQALEVPEMGFISYRRVTMPLDDPGADLGQRSRQRRISRRRRPRARRRARARVKTATARSVAMFLVSTGLMRYRERLTEHGVTYPPAIQPRKVKVGPLFASVIMDSMRMYGQMRTGTRFYVRDPVSKRTTAYRLNKASLDRSKVQRFATDYMRLLRYTP